MTTKRMKPKSERKERVYLFKADYNTVDIIEKEQANIAEVVGKDQATKSLAIRNLIKRGAKQ